MDVYPCHHPQQGLTCFFVDSDGSKHGTLVLNKRDVATIYANLIRGVSNGPTTKALFSKEYTPSINDEEFLDKVGVLVLSTFFNMYKSFPDNYDYNPSFGVCVIWYNAGEKQTVQISPPDIGRMPPGNALDVFRKIEEPYRERFQAATRAMEKGSCSG